jgi:hypothetical protein
MFAIDDEHVAYNQEFHAERLERMLRTSQRAGLASTAFSCFHRS